MSPPTPKSAGPVAETTGPTVTPGTTGTLYVVATPIGNLSDLSQRASDVLRQVAWVAAEDTRVSRVLLERIGSSARMIPVHQHNEQASAARLVERLQAGENLALITDAGTPGISDPGSWLVRAAHAHGVTVIPIPGASAPITLLSASGLPPSPFLFEGFLPPKEKARVDRLRELRRGADLIGAHIVLFEAPHRIERTLASIIHSHGEHRALVIGRELTKRFEEIHACRTGEGPAWLAARPERQRGEFVLAIGALERLPRGDAPDGIQSGLAADMTFAGEVDAGARYHPNSDPNADADSAASSSANADPNSDTGATANADAHSAALDSLGLWPIGASNLGDPTALLTRLMRDMPTSRAVKLAQELTGLPHRDLYSLALTLKNSNV